MGPEPRQCPLKTLRLFRLSFPREALRLGYLVGRHFSLDIVAVACRRVAIFARRHARSGEVVPHAHQYVVLGNSPTFFVHDAEVELGMGFALVCRQPIPMHRVGVVLGNAPAIIVYVAELEVGSCLPLLGGPPMPLRRLGLVLRDAQAICVPKAEGVLSSWVALLSQRTPLIQGRCIVTAIIGFQASLGVRRQHRRG